MLRGFTPDSLHLIRVIPAEEMHFCCLIQWAVGLTDKGDAFRTKSIPFILHKQRKRRKDHEN